MDFLELKIRVLGLKFFLFLEYSERFLSIGILGIETEKFYSKVMSLIS